MIWANRAVSKIGSLSRILSGIRLLLIFGKSVWIKQLNAIYIEKIRWSPHMEEFFIQFEATIVHYVSEQNLSIEIMLCHKDRLLAKNTNQVLDA